MSQSTLIQGAVSQSAASARRLLSVNNDGGLSCSYRATVNLTRPSNTSPAYSANDVLGAADVSVAANAGSAILEFTNIGPAGGNILVTQADLMISLAAVPAGMTSFRLHLYDTSPSAILDNAAWTLATADLPYYLGYIDMGSPALPAASSNALFVQAMQVNQQFKLAAGSTSLFGELITIGGYTPASATVLRARLHSTAI